jgi:hypothetical protein
MPAGPEGGMGMGGMGMGGPNLQLEGMLTAPAAGGEAKVLGPGRILIQDASAKDIVVLYQGQGMNEMNSWGVYGISFDGANRTRWLSINYQWTPAWIRVSPKGDQFAVPWEKNGRYIVFFPATENAVTPVGNCQSDEIVRPVTWDAAGGAVLVRQCIAPKAPAAPAGMGEGMGMGMGMGMGGPAGGMGMGMGMGAAAPQPEYNIGLGKPDANAPIVQIIKHVGGESFAVAVEKGTDIVASLSPAPDVQASQTKSWPGDMDGLYLYDASGQQKAKLSYQRARLMASSPDGKHVAFMWGDKAPFTLSVIPTAGGPISRVAYNLVGSVGGGRPFAWSPDGRKIAYGGLDKEGGDGMFVVDIASGATTRLSTVPKATAPAAAPAVAPAG